MNKDIKDILEIINNAKEAPGGMSIKFYANTIECLGKLGLKTINGDKMVQLQFFIKLIEEFIKDYQDSNVATKPPKDSNSS